MSKLLHLGLGLTLAGCAGVAPVPSDPAASAVARTIAVTPQELRGNLPAAVGDARTPYLTYHGGTMAIHPREYVVFMGWTGSDADPDGEAAYVVNFIRGAAASAWLQTVSQYPDARGATIDNRHNRLAGVWYDDTPDRAINAEAMRAAKHFGDRSASAQFMLLSPHGRNLPDFGKTYCSYRLGLGLIEGRRTIWEPVATYLGYMPDAGKFCGAFRVNRGRSGILDGVSIVAGADVAGYETDVHLSAWFNNQTGYEIADPCWWHPRNVRFATGVFPVTGLWSNAARGCVF